MSRRWQIRGVDLVNDRSAIYPERFEVRLQGYGSGAPEVGGYLIDSRDHDRLVSQYVQRVKELHDEIAQLKSGKDS